MASDGGYWGQGYWQGGARSNNGWNWSGSWRAGWSDATDSRHGGPLAFSDTPGVSRGGATWQEVHASSYTAAHWQSALDDEQDDWERRRPTTDDVAPSMLRPKVQSEGTFSITGIDEDPWHAGADPWAACALKSVASRVSVASAPFKTERGSSDTTDPWAACTLTRVSRSTISNGAKPSELEFPAKSAAFGGKLLDSYSSGAGGNYYSSGVGESTWRGPAASGGHGRGQSFVESVKTGVTGEAPSKFAGAEVSFGVGASQLTWQDEFTGAGHEPLKGKYFNDVIIEKHSGGEILTVVEESMNEFSVVNAVTALHRLAKAGDAQTWRRDPRIKYLNRRITKMFASAKRDEIEKKETGRRVPGNDWVYYIDTRSLTNAAWAFAQLHLKHDELMEAVSEETCKKIYDSNAQQIAILSWSFAKMLRVDLPLMQTLAEETVRRIGEFSSQHLMNFAWGCAKLKFLHVEVMMAVAGMAMTLLEDFTPQHLSITAWAYATLGFRHRNLMEAIAAEVMKTIRAFRPQNIANTAWAYATLELRHEELMEALALAALPHLAGFSQQNLTNLIWSFSSLRIYHEKLFAAVAQQVIDRAHELDSRGLSMTASAFATLGVLHRPLFDGIACASLKIIEYFTPRDLENMVMSFVQLGLNPPELFEAVALQALRKLKDFTSLDLATTAWAFAAADHLNENLMQAVAARSITVIAGGSFPSQALACLAWGFTTLDIRHEALMNAISSEVLSKLDRHDLEHLVTLLDVDLPCREMLACRLGHIIYHFIRALPLTPEGWRSERYAMLLEGLKVDHFGESGTAFLLWKIGVAEGKADFRDRAAHVLSRHLREHCCSPEELVRAGTAQSRAGAVAEYELEIAGRVISGTLVRENAAPSVHRAQPRWLCAVGLLRVGSYVHRGLRGEFLVLEELCELALAGASGRGSARVWGSVRLFSSSFPCISCIGAIMQFRQLLPEVHIEAVNGGPCIGVRNRWG